MADRKLWPLLRRAGLGLLAGGFLVIGTDARSQTPAAPAAPLAAIPSPANNSIISNENILLIPMHPGNRSMMFSAEEMNRLQPFIELYENTKLAKKDNTTPVADKDDLTSLLNSLTHTPEPGSSAPPPPPLPHLFLGAIGYDSPAHWSVWINGRKLVNTSNNPANEFYVSQISRREAEIVWHPASLGDTTARWKALTNNGTDPLPNIVVNEAKGTIIVRMHMNQSFLPASLSIEEGRIKTALPAPPPH